MAKNTKEQEYIDDLEARVGRFYTETKRNLRFSARGECGEIDFMGRAANNGWHVYEIKATGHSRALKRARKQLERAKRCLPYQVSDLFIYIGSCQELIPYRGQK